MILIFATLIMHSH